MIELEDKGNYDIVKKKLEKDAKCYLKNLGLSGKKDVDILIEPGVGNFESGTFEGNMLDYYYHFWYHMMTYILNITKEKDSDLIFHFHIDLSHGVNYMPVLLYRALREIGGILATRYSTKLSVYNSDPYPFGANTPTLNINILEKTTFAPSLPKLPQISTKNNLLYFWASVLYGLPLLIIHLFPNVSDICDKIQNEISSFAENIQIIQEKLVHKYSLNNQFLEYLVIYFYVSLHEPKIFKNINKEMVKKGIQISKLGIRDKTLDLGKTLSKQQRVIFEAELSSIRSKAQSYCQQNSDQKDRWLTLDQIEGATKGTDQIHERNFFAHGGLERNIILIKVTEIVKEGSKSEKKKKEKETTFLKYNPEKINEIKQFLEKEYQAE